MRYIQISAMSIVLALAGCASSSTTLEERKLEVDQILSGPTSTYAQTEAQRCLNTSRYDTVDVLDDRRLLFSGIGGRAWVNELRNRCGGLRASHTLLLEIRDDRVCALDQVSAADRVLFWERVGPRCTLGEFKPVTPEQAQLLRRALD